MYLVYKPEGQQEQRWHYEPGRLRRGEMRAIEDVTGLKYGAPFKQELMQGGTEARAALLWTFLRRDHATLKFKDVDFADDELQLVQDKDELAAEIAALEDDEIEGLTQIERAAGLALLRRQLSEAPDAPGKAPTATTAGLQSGGVLSPESGRLGLPDGPPPYWVPDPTPPETAPTPPPAAQAGPAPVPVLPAVAAASTT